MPDENQVRVRIPCSTSNLGPGFDTISAALDLYLTLNVSITSKAGVEWSFSGEIPGENIIATALDSALDYMNHPLPGLRISVDNPIPLKRGLGSSGAAIIGGIKLASWLSGRELTQREILSLAYPLEGHPDNLSASLLGGWVLSRVDDEMSVTAERLPSKLHNRFVVCVPEVEVSTAKAREILPEGYSLQDVAFNLQRVSLLVHALNTGQTYLLREATRDRIHQSFRASLVPGLDAVLALEGILPEIEPVIMGVTVSGSGSTVLAIVQGSEEVVGEWMVDCFAKAGIHSRYLVLDLDQQGAVVLD